ncbi:MAG: hypothetical protein NTU69_10750 [Proteobacteria bacterium]|nr:hypothetical protein [Pseudomonadota bacterium]
MKLWLLDADVIIDLLGLDTFDKLLKNHEIFAASTVIDEVRHYIREGCKIAVEFRQNYVVNNNLINELSATAEEIQKVLAKLPAIRKEALHGGELESLAILLRESELTFCSCDAATIRALPFLGLSERGISVENLLQTSGLSQSGLKERHTKTYFKNNLSIGQREKVQY